jgi:hypothetical protein
MVAWLMRRAIGAFERTWNYDARYLYDILEASPRVEIHAREPGPRCGGR